MTTDSIAVFNTGTTLPAIVNTLLYQMVKGSGTDCDSGRADRNELAEIVKGCRKNDEKSCEKLYKKFYGYAFSISIKYCINREDAIEVVNDSFMKVFDHIHKYDLEKPFKPWLRRIVVNSSIDRVRKHKGHHVDIDDVPLSGVHHVEEELTVKETLALLEQLPEIYRAVFNMYEIDGYSHREISKELGIGESSSRTYLMRARNQLKSLYNQYFTGKSYHNAKSGSN